MKHGIALILLFSCTSCSVITDASKDCSRPNHIEVELNSKYFEGKWFSQIDIGDDAIETYDCDFQLNGNFSCHVIERGPLNKEQSVYHTDEYWEKGIWTFETNSLLKTINGHSQIQYTVVSANQSNYVLSDGRAEYWFTKEYSCLGS
ncbi:hypothetical protein QWY77_11750 [Thalassotalea ponticola]|uniref:hypothetical protein n=1 Tax=Thalassotalea ponticola TaxID=1523392 RepID=UPI0025B43D92|nr:hypothetical protein [Thalassotalea ponticola]MDN3653416.1 hypothetical protein [Thalassotalea ponticola]